MFGIGYKRKKTKREWEPLVFFIIGFSFFIVVGVI